IHLMGERGGWPLNVFALPDGRPIYGVTYLPKENWSELLKKLNDIWVNERDSLLKRADKIEQGLKQSSNITAQKDADIPKEKLHEMVEKWKTQFDHEYGGTKGAPKFPLPHNYQFLLKYSNINNDAELNKFTHFTLKKMAFGGIYDQIGGGFSRYSTDPQWKVPHFEKMLYDNAQLVSLYSEAYQDKPLPLYKEVVYETLDYVNREMTDETGGFYSSLDADSEGEEGKYYVWEVDELKSVLGEKYDLAKDYYNINSYGKWEHGKYILIRDKTDEQMAEEYNMGVDELKSEIQQIDSLLFKARKERVMPGLDDKILTSWNALMLKAYVDAYETFNEKRFLDAALNNANFLLNNQIKEDGSIHRNFKNGKSTINGYLSDISFTIEAFIALYEVTFDKKWLNEAKKLANHAFEHYFDEKKGLFYYSSDQDPELISREIEFDDNVIPASNSSMAKGLYKLGLLFDNKKYKDVAKDMVSAIEPYLSKEPSHFTNWGQFLLHLHHPVYEIAVMGQNALSKRKEFNKKYIPLKVFLGNKKDEDLPLLKNKYDPSNTMIYVCENKTCKLPVKETEAAFEQIEF
ncbi:MAG: thioredoxin domain-containing protein, partial [Flavobacteriales bacterium]